MPVGEINPLLAAAIGTLFGLLVTTVAKAFKWLMDRLTKCEAEKQALIDASVTAVQAQNARYEVEIERLRRRAAKEVSS